MEGDDPREPKLAEDVDVISREEWGAVSPRKVNRLKIPIPNVIFTYCTDTETRKWELCKTQEECCATMRDMQRFYMEEENMRDIPYNFVVGGDGRVYEGRGWYAKPAKNKRWPEIYGRSFEIAYLGDHHERRPRKRMWRAAWDFLVLSIIEKGVVDDDYEFIENYDEDRLDEIQAKKPWYQQYYHYAGAMPG